MFVAAASAVQTHTLSADIHTCALCVSLLLQAALAAGLLQVLPFQPRTVGMLGVAASMINCYMLMPSYPVAAKAKTA